MSADVEGHAPRTRDEDHQLGADRSVDETTSKAEAGKHILILKSLPNSDGKPRKAADTDTPALAPRRVPVSKTGQVHP